MMPQKPMQPMQQMNQQMNHQMNYQGAYAMNRGPALGGGGNAAAY